LRSATPPKGDRLDVLVTLVEAWERKHYPLDLPDPVEAIKYHMDQNGLSPRDLIPFIGSRNRVHEVLNRRRPLTLKMIWRLHTGLGIPQSRSSNSDRTGQPEVDGGFVTRAKVSAGGTLFAATRVSMRHRRLSGINRGAPSRLARPNRSSLLCPTRVTA
jgi:antitoxin component HigA of HigAB toxin-antitoxin module